MFLDLSPEQRKLQDQLRSTSRGPRHRRLREGAVRQRGGGPSFTARTPQARRRRLARHRLAARVRRQDRTPIEQFLFFDEAARAGVVHRS